MRDRPRRAAAVWALLALGYLPVESLVARLDVVDRLLSPGLHTPLWVALVGVTFLVWRVALIVGGPAAAVWLTLRLMARRRVVGRRAAQ